MSAPPEPPSRTEERHLRLHRSSGGTSQNCRCGWVVHRLYHIRVTDAQMSAVRYCRDVSAEVDGQNQKSAVAPCRDRRVGRAREDWQSTDLRRPCCPPGHPARALALTLRLPTMLRWASFCAGVSSPCSGRLLALENMEEVLPRLLLRPLTGLLTGEGAAVTSCCTPT